MKATILTVLRRLSWLEDYLPAKGSIRLRFFLQKHLGFLEPEFDLLPLLTDSRKKAVDAGANTGVFAYRLSMLASEVHAFEPIWWLAQRLTAAKLPNVHVVGVALSDVSGTATIKIPVIGGITRHTRAALDGESDGAIEQEVTLKALDHYHLDNVGFVKIDVEGHEYALLVGAEGTILNNRPNIFIEIESWRLTGDGVEGVFGLFSKWSYRGYFYWKGSLRTIDEFLPSVHQARRDALYKNDDYVNNFIFLPSESPLVLPKTIKV